MLLAAIALAFALIFGGSTPSPSAPPPAAPAPVAVRHSQLPPTQPGLGQDEGVFFVTTADDGSQAVYFIAGNARHSILWTDMQTELQLNPLWPVYSATSDQVLAYPEGAPVGAAKTGLLAGPAPTSNDSPSSQPASYTLKPGDNLTRIAAQYGTSVDAILAANGLINANRVEAGQTLVIPTGDTPPVADDTAAPAADASTPVADASAPDAGAPDASAPDASASDASAADPSADAATADAPAAADDSASADATTYTVQPGDSAFKIARKFGVDQGALLDANGITNPNRVYVGQVLTIPGSSS